LKKLVVKTAIITLASLICTLLIAFGALAVCAPNYLGRVFDGTGNHSVAVFFYEKQFEKTGNVDDLNTLVLKLDVKDDSQKAEKYYKKIIEHSDFESLCQSQNSQNGLIGAKDFYVGQYVLSLAYNGKFEDAVAYSKDYIGASYQKNNPFQSLIYNYLTSDKVDQINAVKVALEEVEQGLTETSQFLTEDKAYIDTLINN
jgi:hypothetical protein